MTEFSIELASEQIADTRTREYFLEVLSSHINGNYRSAVVMLWSVVVADLVYKMQTLRDLYQDPVATSIMNEIEAKQLANPTSPEWEQFLVDAVASRMHLLEGGDPQHLANLQRLRHLSAHPVLTGSNLLFSPNKETSRALIRNALEAVLLKPPVFSKKIVTEFVADIAAKKEVLPDQNALRRYLHAKYFKSLSIPVERELFKSLWKFCFRISNPDADSNREINVRALLLIYERHPTELRKFILDNPSFFSEVAATDSPLRALVEFLSEVPVIFSALTDAARVPLAAFAESDVNLLAKASFIHSSFADHVSQLTALEYTKLRELTDESWEMLVTKAAVHGLLQQIFGIAVKVYTGSGGFNIADIHFTRFIAPHIAQFDRATVVELLNGIEGNNQTYRRGRSRIDHASIAERVHEIGDVNLDDYPHFVESLPTTDSE